MTTSIESLPLLRVTQGVGSDEDWILSISFVDGGGNALSLAGIAFRASVSLLGMVIATASGVVSGNAVTFTIFAASKANWAVGNYLIGILATDGTNSKDVLTANSLLTVGSPSPAVITAVSGNQAPGPSAVSAQTAANTSAIAALEAAVAGLQAPFSPGLIAASQAISGPGTYLITTPGVTLTMPSAAAWIGGDVFFVDWTGSSSPNITITGAFDLSATSLTIAVAGGAVWLRPYPAGPNFIVMGAGSGGPGGGGLGISTTLAVGSSEL